MFKSHGSTAHFTNPPFCWHQHIMVLIVLRNGNYDIVRHKLCWSFSGNQWYWMRYLSTSGPKCTWWRHRMETFSGLLAICAGNSPVAGEFPAQRPVTRSFDVFFDLRLNKRLSKQWWGWWFETLWRPLWRHCNVWWGHGMEILLTSLPISTNNPMVDDYLLLDSISFWTNNWVASNFRCYDVHVMDQHLHDPTIIYWLPWYRWWPGYTLT